jgi:hypothetical protein
MDLRCSQFSSDVPIKKKSGPGLLRGPTYTARGSHPTVLLSWFRIVTTIVAVKLPAAPPLDHQRGAVSAIGALDAGQCACETREADWETPVPVMEHRSLPVSPIPVDNTKLALAGAEFHHETNLYR